jgi:WD40 repeat protein
MTDEVRVVPLFRKHAGQTAVEHEADSNEAGGRPAAQQALSRLRIETLGVIPRRGRMGFAAPLMSVSAATGRVAYAESKGVFTYDVSDLNGSERQLDVDPGGLVGGMTFSQSGRYLALPRATAATMATPAYGVNGVICDLDTGNCRTLLSGRHATLAGSHGAFGIVIDPTDSLVAVADLDDCLHVRRLDDWGDNAVPVLRVLEKWGSIGLAWSADGQTLYHAGSRWEKLGPVRKLGRLRCTSPSELSFESAQPIELPAKKPLRGFGMLGLAAADGAGLVAVGGDKGADAIHVFELATSTEVCRGVTPKAATPYLLFSGDGTYLLSVSTDNTLRLWHIVTGPDGRTLQLEGAQQFVGEVVAVDAMPGSGFDMLVVAMVNGAAGIYRVSLPIAG